MATGPEMMIKTVFKALGLDGEKVMAQVNGIRGTIDQIGSMMSAILANSAMANRRLHRIEAHLGLSDIEPVPEIMVITNEVTSVSGASERDDASGA